MIQSIFFTFSQTTGHMFRFRMHADQNRFGNRSRVAMDRHDCAIAMFTARMLHEAEFLAIVVSIKHQTINIAYPLHAHKPERNNAAHPLTPVNFHSHGLTDLWIPTSRNETNLLW